LISFFASTWGSFGSGTLSEWVQTFFRHPTLFSFSLAAFFPWFRRFRHALSFLPAVFSLSPLTHSSLFTFAIAALFPRLLAIAAKPGTLFLIHPKADHLHLFRNLFLFSLLSFIKHQ
jgi:hypothetical protein